jgi:quinol-cytochrome oxidoreductase complex cytochrome b subunit
MLMSRILEDKVVAFLNDETKNYFAPVSLSYNWCYGYIALLMFALQMMSGIILAMWYVPHVSLAFDSVQFIMYEVNSGWLIRYLHVNCVSFVFISMYLHIFRGLYYGSFVFPRGKIWISGLAIFLLMIITAFLGYVLPWGQMSYWGATVITSFISVVPYFGKSLQIFIWGGFFIDQPALGKFYSLHYLFPFVILGLIGLHFVYLHTVGSNNPLGVETNDRIPLYPYFIWKDAVWFMVFLFFLLGLVFFFPNLLNHPDNSIPANPSCTPEHIVPEWYFLLFYAILRSVPNKELGVILMIFSIVVLGLLTFLIRICLAENSGVNSGRFRIFFKPVFWFLFFICIILGILGACPLATPYLEVSKWLTFLYFFLLLILFPVSLFLDNWFLFLWQNQKLPEQQNFFRQFSNSVFNFFQAFKQTRLARFFY